MRNILFILFYLSASLVSHQAWAVSGNLPIAPQAEQIFTVTALTAVQQNKFLKLRTNLATSEKRLGSQHPIIANLLENIGILHQEAKQYHEARQSYWKAMRVAQGYYPTQHPAFIILLSRIARSHFLEKNYAVADKYYMQAFNRMSNALGTQHIETANFLNRLATIYYNEGLYQQAEPLLVNALSLYQTNHSSQHPQVRTILQELEGVYNQTGQRARAVDIKNKIRQLRS